MESVALEMKTVTGVGIGDRATIGRLRMAEMGTVANRSEIAVSRERIGKNMMIELIEAGFAAIVCVGEAEEESVVTARELGVPILFVSEEDIGSCVCEENAVLYPDRGVLFVSPTVEVIDRFIRDEEAETRFDTSFDMGRVYEIGSGRPVGRVVDVSNIMAREEELFEIYCRLIEEGSGELCVCLRQREDIHEHLRALMRAAVYGRVSVLFPSKTPQEHQSLSGILRTAEEELTREGREIDGGLRVGVITEDIFGVLYASELYAMADFLVVNPLEIKRSVLFENSDDACERYLSLIRERLSSIRSGIFVLDAANRKDSSYSKK